MEYKWIKNEKGLTLVELLASIVILSIIVAAFLTFFINSARTTNVAEEVVDATYVTQQQMESIYHLATTNSFNQFIDAMKDQADHSQTNSSTHRFTISSNSYRLEVTVEPVKDNDNNSIPDLIRLLIKTYDKENRQKVQMETRLLTSEAGGADD
ncbi:type IV pilus modification PilV family protein [Gracilibacillus kekensis]|uniref:Prepilin-type N-terminal cleavage/methylation domain-containing protein n=1 Tax=Gracilibacillus kekensis TaxID=1027249 RepID=A0A1M7NWE9_9BACI|nr:type II secretion system protein [Gracilibacillus kekensis]SHN08345.1 prepilin-type N-terminal cleavage/methylation domain-containing protein [Gracilibacillus kekensis]